MQNKSNLNINTGENSGALADSSPAEKFSIENIPVYSMKKDLEMLKNPAMIRPESTPLPTSSDSRYAASPKISPFLEKTDTAPLIPVSQKITQDKTVFPVNQQLSELEQETSDSSNQFDLKKILVFSIIFLSVIALGVGSYYFWLVRGEKSELTSEEPATTVPVEEPVLPVAIFKPEIETEESKENVVILELENSTQLTLKEALASQIKKLSDSQSTAPLEFKLRDSKNNPISFQVFAEKTGMTFVKDVSAYLGETFRLFVFNDKSQISLGLILESKNDTLLAKEILKKEPSLVENLDVFLLEKFEKPAKVSFSNNIYKGISVRYFNIISPEKLTIDYAIAKNKLFFGTTRNTIYALYDLITP